MEDNFGTSNEGASLGNASINQVPSKSPYSSVRTIYYTCDSNIFKSSESSVQVVSANNKYNATVGRAKPNFCELDIISKKEKLKFNVDFVPMQTITEELKSLPMTSNLKGPGNGFRKKIYHKPVNDEPNEVLCLANVVKDEETAFKPILNRSIEVNNNVDKKVQTYNNFNKTKHPHNVNNMDKSKTPQEINNLDKIKTQQNIDNTEKGKVDETCQTKKKSRSSSKKRKPKETVPQDRSEMPSRDIDSIPKFADLGTAKTMYFVELPNKSGFINNKDETAEARPTKSEKTNKKKRKKSKSRKGNTKTRCESTKEELGDIIINKIESDFPPLSSRGSVSTNLSHGFKKHSDFSFGSADVSKSARNDFKRRNNSPNSEDTFLDDFLRKSKGDSPSYKEKHRKKHRTSPSDSFAEDVSKTNSAEKQINLPKGPETEVTVIYKVDQVTNQMDNATNVPKKKKKSSQTKKYKKSGEKHQDAVSSVEDHSQIQPKYTSKSNIKDLKENKEMLDTIGEKKQQDDNMTKNVVKDDSVLNLYVASKPLKSESGTMIVDEDLVPVKNKRKSRRSKSRSLTPSKQNCEKADRSKIKDQEIQEEMALLENAKERKTKQRSKSRAPEEKGKKTRHKSKSHLEDDKQEVTKKMSRKSASDVLQKEPEKFDFKSIEGIKRSGKISEKKHKSISSLVRKESKEQTSKTSTKIIEDGDNVGVVEKMRKVQQITITKDKKKRSKSSVPNRNAICQDKSVDKLPVSSKSHVFESGRSSETCINKRHLHSKKSNSFLVQNRCETLYFAENQTLSAKDSVCEDLKKVSNVQYVDATRRRFKVVSKKIRSHLSDGSTTQSTDHTYGNKKFGGSNRFRTYICTEKEKEAILKLPIFNKNESETVEENFLESNSNLVNEKVSFATHEYETSEFEEYLVREEKLRRKKKIRKASFRREVSFSHLNVSPFMDVYKKSSKPLVVRKALQNDTKFNRSYFDIFRPKNSVISTNELSPHSELVSEDTDQSLCRKDSSKKLNSVTIILGEKILEIYTKATDESGRIIEGFTVSGSEPPKKLNTYDIKKDKVKLMSKAAKLHGTSLPSLQIIDGVMIDDSIIEISTEQRLVQLNAKESSDSVSKVSTEVMTEDYEIELKETQDELTQAESKEILATMKSPIFLKTKKKFGFGTKKKSKGNLKKELQRKISPSSKNIQTSTESHSNSDSIDVKEPFHKSFTVNTVTEDAEIIWKQQPIQKVEIKIPTRMSSAVKLMESSLQIIKEESQSTDSSSKKSTDKNFLNEKKPCELEIKETQTDFNVNDMDKLKEVLTYLYNSIDHKKQESLATITESMVNNQHKEVKKTQDLSSTDSSSSHEQFKNFVKNITPKFVTGKKSSKHDIKAPKSDIVTSKIPTLCKRPSRTTTKDCKPEVFCLSTSEASSSSSDEKIEKNIPPKKQVPKNYSRRRSSSVDVLSSSYFEKYKGTQELIEQQKKKRAESEDSKIKRKTQEPEFKSSTSVSDFSSVVVSFKEKVEKDLEGVAMKKSEEKYVQCVLVADLLKEYVDKNIGTITEDEKASKRSSKVSTKNDKKSGGSKKSSKMSVTSQKKCETIKNKDVSVEVDYINIKNVEDKSLQTSIKKEDVPNEEVIPGMHRFNILYTDVPQKSKNKMITGLLQKLSSHSFITRRKSPMKISKNRSREENRKNGTYIFEKNPVNQIDEIKCSTLNYNMSEKRNKLPETEYVNLIKLERHLQRVLRLYPSIFKTIRAHMDDVTARKLEKHSKFENSDLYTSCDTLATTIDTVTEYKNTDCFEKVASFSESNLGKFNKYYENFDYQQYQMEQFIESQHHIVSKNNIPLKKIDMEKDIKHSQYPRADSISSISNMKIKSRCKKAKGSFKPKLNKKQKNTAKKELSLTSVFSKDDRFLSSSCSSCCADNWSVASPLYSITTPSVNVSLYAHSAGRSQSSRSLMLSKPTQTKVTKSKSVIEMSSIKKINRKLMIKHLLEGGFKSKTEKLNHNNVLVVSVNSSCTVFATPSKFLANVEKHLKESDPVKAVEATKPKFIEVSVQKNEKKEVVEQSLHSMFFSDDKNTKVTTNNAKNSKKPFYIHKMKDSTETDEEFLDSLEVKPPISTPNESPENEDFGNFSADSLEAADSKRQKGKPFAKNNIGGIAPQNYFVYSNTVDYDKNSRSRDRKKDINRIEQPSQNQQESLRNLAINNVQNTSSTGISNQDNTSNTLISESGYESNNNKSKKTASIRNFFKKGGSLLDLFRNSSKNKITKSESMEKNETPKPSNSNLTTFSDLYQKKQELNVETKKDTFPLQTESIVYWTSYKNVGEMSVKSEKTTFSELADSSSKKSRSSSPQKHSSPSPKTSRSPSPNRSNKGTSMSFPKQCLCSDPVKSYQKQMDECHAYAEKVLLESQMRREGYYKQYQDFKEIPLELMIGKRIPNKSKTAQELYVQTRPKTKPTSTQFRRHIKAKGVEALATVVPGQQDNYVKTQGIICGKSQDTQNPCVDTMELFFRSENTQSSSPAFKNESKRKMRDKGSPSRKTTKDIGIDVVETTSKVFITQDHLDNEIKAIHFANTDTVVLRNETSAHSDKGIVAKMLKRSDKPKTVAYAEPPDEKSASAAKAKTQDKSTYAKIPKSVSENINESILSKPSVNYRNIEKSSGMDKIGASCTKKDMDTNMSTVKQEKVPLITRFKAKIKCKPRSRSPSIPKEEEKVEEKDEYTETMDQYIDTEDTSKGCWCDGKGLLPKPKTSTPESTPEKTPSLSSAESIPDESENDKNFIANLLQEIVEEAMVFSDGFVKPEGLTKLSQSIPNITLSESITAIEESTLLIIQEKTEDETEVCRRTSEDFRQGLTDKQVFDKLLSSFEKVDEIAARLSKDETFFKEQIKTIKRDSEESIEEEEVLDGSSDPNDIIYSDDPISGKHRNTHFWEERMIAMREKEENPVKEDDIGTCFSRGFRPDNIALSGDACFSLNKQDRLKFPKGMLTDEESIIDFSERETPLDYLLALGFMVDEASNALKDEDIRSRLLAAITEARVWINKITTTQGTLLYLVAYKSRPKTMRYFLQLVEAIINKRINNAIKLDGFLRVLEKVEEGEIQMINILGADKFEDEENEEKIVKKQLRQLFITVYKIAEKEAMLKSKQLSQQAIVLLRILAAKYRAGLHPHLELIARYIGQELLNTETQLEAAMIFLSRLDTAEVKLKEFEAYCDIKCDKKKKKKMTIGEEEPTSSDTKGTKQSIERSEKEHVKESERTASSFNTNLSKEKINNSEKKEKNSKKSKKS